MIPVYFPFTHMSESIFDCIITLFPGITVYQPSTETVPESMEKLATDSRFEIRFPVSSDENTFKSLIQEFHKWSDLHQLSDRRNIKRHQGYSGSRTPSQIRTEVQRRLRGEDTEDRADPLLKARQFLVFAQEFDLQNESLQNDIRIAEDLETEFLNNLTGERTGIDPKTNILFRHDTEPYMIQERLVAWCMLAQQDGNTPDLLITSSQPAFEHIMDMTSAESPVIEIENLSSGKLCADGASKTEEALSAYLADHLTSPSPENEASKIIEVKCVDSKNLHISVGITPNKSPHDCYSMIISRQQVPEPLGTLQKNTVIVLIKPVQ